MHHLVKVVVPKIQDIVQRYVILPSVDMTMNNRRSIDSPQYKAKAARALGDLRVIETTAEVPDRAEVHPRHDCCRIVGVAQKCRRTLACGQASKKPANTQIDERSRQIGQVKAENNSLLEPDQKSLLAPSTSGG